MYLPIPEGVSVSQTVTAFLPIYDCYTGEGSASATASFTLAPSTVSRHKRDNSVSKRVNRPTDGKWRDVKKSGIVKMTPMEIINEETTYHVGQMDVPFISTNKAVYFRHLGRVSGGCKNCKVKYYDVKFAVVKGRYVEQGDLDYWKSKYPMAQHYGLPRLPLDPSQIEAAKTSVYAELFQSFNLGEELVELRETIGMVTKLTKEAVGLILNSKQQIVSLLKKGKLELASDRWMEFRYGIMPVIYSVQDILKLSSESGCYRTTRATVRGDLEDQVLPEEGVYFHDVGFHDSVAHITAKGRWASEGIKKFDLVNINPVTTLTSVLPYAMVVRWFFNVQSYLDTRIKSLTSLALEYDACVAVKTTSDYVTYLSAPVGYQGVRSSWDGVYGVCGAGYFPVVNGPTYSDRYRAEVALVTVKRKNYKRYLFKPTDAKLVFAPYISWQRIVDGCILGRNRLSNLLRRLK